MPIIVIVDLIYSDNTKAFLIAPKLIGPFDLDQGLTVAYNKAFFFLKYSMIQCQCRSLYAKNDFFFQPKNGSNERHPDVAICHFSQLLQHKQFLLKFIRTLEKQKSFGIRDK